MNNKVKKLYVEVASTPTKQEYGLMYRKRLGENEGMLFKFNRSDFRSFWMLDTYIPLDIAFLDDNGKILQIKEMVPLSLKSICSKKPCRYVLEVNRGWFYKNNVFEGMTVAGLGIKRLAQNLPPNQPNQSNQQPNANVIIEKTIKEKLKDANIRGKKLIVLYQTKDGLNLPPKSISPPFIFEDNAEGDTDGVVKAWDNQTAGWKSFLVDNILSLEYDEK